MGRLGVVVRQAAMGVIQGSLDSWLITDTRRPHALGEQYMANRLARAGNINCHALAFGLSDEPLDGGGSR